MVQNRSFFVVMLFYLLFIPINTIANQPLVFVSENSTSIVLKFSLPQYSIRSLRHRGETYQYISVPHSGIDNKIGYPELPLFSQSIIIKPNEVATYSASDIEYKIITVDQILPSTGPVSRSVRSPWSTRLRTTGTVYSHNHIYPTKTISFGKPHKIRDIHGMVLTIHPFQYNPIQKTLKITQSMTITIQKAPQPISYDNGEIMNKGPTAAFELVYGNHFINYTQKKKRFETQISDGDNMVLITTNVYKNAVKPLVEWKNRCGIFTRIYEYPTETGGIGSAILKNFLAQKYAADNITYVLLVGDLNDIPSYHETNLWDGQSGYSDPNYVLYSGNDFYPDAFIGRLSVESVEEAHIIISKIIHYEQKPSSQDSWYNKATGIASEEGVPPDYNWMDTFRDSLLSYTFTGVDQIYDPGATTSDIIEAVNDGRSWITYMGHGLTNSWGTTGFTSSHITNLKNDEKLPVVISVACLNGKFDETCFAENWTRHANGGALAFFGATISQPWIPPQYGAENIINNLIGESVFTLGSIIYNGEMSMLDRTTSNDTYDAINSTFLTWTLFGDPSLLIHTDSPVEQLVTHPTHIGLGSQKVTIKAEDKAKICLYGKSQNIYATGIVTKGELSLSINTVNSDTIHVTATKRNRIPYCGFLIADLNAIATTGTLSKGTVNPVSVRNLGTEIAIKKTIPEPVKASLFDSRGKCVSEYVVTKSHQWIHVKKPMAAGVFHITIQVNNQTILHSSMFVF